MGTGNRYSYIPRCPCLYDSPLPNPHSPHGRSHSRTLYRRTADAHRHRRRDPGARHAEEGGSRLVGTLSIPRRALPFVHGQSGQAVLPLLRLRRAWQRDPLPDGLRPARISRCDRGTGGARGPQGRIRRRRAQGARQRQRRPVRPARCGDGVLSRTTDAQCTREGLLQPARAGSGHPRTFPARLCTGPVGRAEKRTRHQCATRGPARQGRHAGQRRTRRQVRPLPPSRHVSDSRSARAHDRLRRPHHGLLRERDSRSRRGDPRFRQGIRTEVPQLPRDTAFPQGSGAVRTLAGTRCESEDRAPARGRRLHGCDRPASVRHHPGRRHPGYGDHQRSRRNPVPQFGRRVFLFRRRSRRKAGRVACGRIRAAAHARRTPGLVPVRARRRRSRFADPSGRA